MSLVLVVDDNRDACRMLASLIRYVYGDAAWVTSGKDALAFVDANPVDLVILDVMMPEMDGLEVLRRLRQKPTTAKLPVVMFSAVNDPEFRRRAFDNGASEFWLKASLDFRYLKDHLQRLLVPPKSNPQEPPN
jgi:CheY-like chemotaxis protein